VPVNNAHFNLLFCHGNGKGQRAAGRITWARTSLFYRTSHLLFSNQDCAFEMFNARNGASRYFQFACCRADIYRFPVISGEPDMSSQITRKRVSATRVNADPGIRRPYRMPVCARYRNPERRQAWRRGSLEQRRQHPQTPRIRNGGPV